MKISVKASDLEGNTRLVRLSTELDATENSFIFEVSEALEFKMKFYLQHLA